MNVPLVVVSDTSVITHLAKLNLLDLLRALFDVVHIPRAVHAELTHSEGTPGAAEAQSLPWLRCEAVARTALLTSLQQRLGAGESEAIILAIQKRADLLLMDERQGRAEAAERGIRVRGLVGILISGKRRGLIAQVKPHLDALRATRFKIGQALYEEALRMADEG